MWRNRSSYGRKWGMRQESIHPVNKEGGNVTSPMGTTRYANQIANVGGRGKTATAVILT